MIRFLLPYLATTLALYGLAWVAIQPNYAALVLRPILDGVLASLGF